MEFDVKGSAPAAQLILELPKESGDKSLGSYLIRDTVAKGAAAMRSLSIDQTKHVISYLEGINAGLSLFGEANRSEGKSKRPILEARSSNLFRDGPAASKSPFLAELLDKVSALQLTGDTLPPDSNIIAEKRGANWTYIMQLPTPIRAAAGLRGWLSAKIDSLADTMGWVRPKATPRLLGEFCLCSPEKGTYQARAEDALTKRTISQDFKSLPEALLYTHGLMRGALIRAG